MSPRERPATAWVIRWFPVLMIGVMVSVCAFALLAVARAPAWLGVLIPILVLTYLGRPLAEG